MRCYLEIWLKDSAKDQLRSFSNQDPDTYNPHITIIRPFEIKKDSDRDEVKSEIINFCKGIEPIPFYLEGYGNFDDVFHYVPIVEDGRLMGFNNGLEARLNEYVNFYREIDKEKKFHSTVKLAKIPFSCPRIDLHMFRLTALYSKEIWFEQDFVTGETLSRKEALDEGLWDRTAKEGREKYGDDLVKVA